jgi:hypothetical protein
MTTSSEIAELRKLVDELPISNEEKERFQIIVNNLEKRCRLQKQSLSLRNYALEDLRYAYRMTSFDLQATRRERDELLRRLNSSNRKNGK